MSEDSETYPSQLPKCLFPAPKKYIYSVYIVSKRENEAKKSNKSLHLRSWNQQISDVLDLKNCIDD